MPTDLCWVWGCRYATTPSRGETALSNARINRNVISERYQPLLKTQERLQQIYDRQQEESLAVHDVPREARAKAKQKNQNDLEMLEMENAAPQQCVTICSEILILQAATRPNASPHLVLVE